MGGWLKQVIFFYYESKSKFFFQLRIQSENKKKEIGWGVRGGELE